MFEVMGNFIKKIFSMIWRIIRVVWGIFAIYCIIGAFKQKSILNIIVSIFILLILIAIEVLKNGIVRRCPSCNKLFALKKMNTERVNTEAISVKTELNTRDKDGKITGTQEQYIPGTRTTYCVNYVCKICGKKTYSSYYKDRKNI